jgi:hypothetical protein
MTVTTPEVPGGTLGRYLDMLHSCFALALLEAEAAPCRLSKVPTPVPALDLCCECGDGEEGQAWVSMNRVSPIGDDQRGSPCATIYEVTFVLGLSRCVPTLDEEGNAPGADELNAATDKQMRDFLLMRAAACCWADNLDLPNGKWRYGEWVAQPASGGCQVSTLTVFARVALGCC